MTTKNTAKRPSTGKAKKLELNKETLKDLATKREQAEALRGRGRRCTAEISGCYS